MNLFIFKLTARQRYILALLFTVVNLLQVLVGMVMTGGSIFIVVTVSPKFYSEKAEITFVFTVTGMFGTHVMITYLIGIKIGDKCFNLAHKKSTGRHLQVWTIGSCNTTINIFVIALMASKISKHIVRSLRHSLEKGLHYYLRDTNWKHVIDKWQFNMQCCGINKFDDWHKFTWIDKYHINADNDLVKELRTSKEQIHLPIVPWSCCKIDFPMQCFHDPLQQINAKQLWTDQPNLVLDSINNDGCLNILKKPVEMYLSFFIIFCAILVSLQIILIIMSRILYTSCKNAIILGDPDGIAPGWIFTRNMFGGKRGRTLSEILFDLGVRKDQIARYQVFQEESPIRRGNSLISTPSTAKTSEKSPSKIQTLIRKISGKITNKPSESYEEIDKALVTSDADPISSEDEAALML